MQDHLTKKLKRYARWFFLSFTPIVFCVGVALLIYSFSLAKEVSESESWPMTPGRFIEGRVHQQSNNSGNNRRSHSYRVIVSYEFEVDAQLYQGDKVVLGNQNLSQRAEAEEQLQAISNASPLAVYYDPEDPSRAILHPGNDAGVIELQIVGLCFMGLSFLWTLVVWLITR